MKETAKPGQARPLLALTAMVALVVADLWWLWDHPELQALVRSLAASVLIASLFIRHRTSPAVAPGQAAGRAWLETAVVTSALGLAVVGWAVAVSGPLDEPDWPNLAIPALGFWLGHRLVLATIQQLVLQLFLGPVAREALGDGPWAIFGVAALFGLFHLPSVPFAVATGVAAALWLGLYRRSRRLAPLIASHALLAILASTLPERLFLDMKVGAPALEIAAQQRALAIDEMQAMLGAISSPRYAAYRGDTDFDYVAGLYRDILGRVGTEAEVRDGVEQLQQISRRKLAQRMLLAEELDATTLWRRTLDDEPLAAPAEITAASDPTRFTGWYEAEDEWRWANALAPTITFPIDPKSDRPYVLAISGGAATPVGVELELNGDVVSAARFTDFIPRDHRSLIQPEQLIAGGENTLRLLIAPDRPTAKAPNALEGETRALSFGLRSLRLAPLRFPSAAILHVDDDYFLEGFSIAEERLRWTSGPVARLAYPLRRIEPDGYYNLRLEAGAFERQTVGVRVGGERIADWIFEGLEPQTRSVRLDVEQLTSGTNLVEFHLPDARSPEGDPRQLGLAFISLRIYPLKDCG